MDKTIEMLRETYDPKLVDEGDPWDIATAYYDWDEVAMAWLAKICRHCGAFIVLHSSWIQWNSLERLKLFFSFYGLSEYVLDKCPEVGAETIKAERKRCGYFVDEKVIKIRKWLQEHADMVRQYTMFIFVRADRDEKESRRN
ncbi:MAG: hypothetical protein IJ088_14810 [Clostridia bacterium]|nr:hypothetical protein [Clostridia bacterium]